jgi:hypothetical protein
METYTSSFDFNRHFKQVIQFITYGDSNTRKRVVMLARHLGLPQNKFGNLYFLTKHVIHDLSRLSTFRIDPITHSPYKDESTSLSLLNDFFNDPIVAGGVIYRVVKRVPKDLYNGEISMEVFGEYVL